MPRPVHPVVSDDSHQSIGLDDEQQNWLLPVGKIISLVVKKIQGSYIHLLNIYGICYIVF